MMRHLLLVSALLLSACGRESAPESSDLDSLPLSRAPKGKLCTPDDPHFDGFRYPSHVAHCARSVSRALKDAVARRYGIPSNRYYLYEFDHYIPLNAGGANDIDNLWPQRRGEADQKDELEFKIFQDLSSGAINQAKAIAEIKAWRPH